MAARRECRHGSFWGRCERCCFRCTHRCENHDVEEVRCRVTGCACGGWYDEEELPSIRFVGNLEAILRFVRAMLRARALEVNIASNGAARFDVVADFDESMRQAVEDSFPSFREFPEPRTDDDADESAVEGGDDGGGP